MSVKHVQEQQESVRWISYGLGLLIIWQPFLLSAGEAVVLAETFSEQVQALAMLIGVIIIPVVGLVAIFRMKHISTEMRGMKVTMDHELVRPLKHINSAVNNVPLGEVSLVKRVVQIESKLENHIEQVEEYQRKLSHRLGIDVNK
jgi:hypothetical protein